MKVKSETARKKPVPTASVLLRRRYVDGNPEREESLRKEIEKLKKATVRAEKRRAKLAADERGFKRDGA